MRFWVERGGRRIDVEVHRIGERFEVRLDGQQHNVELVPVSGSLASLVLENGRSFSLAHQRTAPGTYRVSLGDREFQVALRDPLEREVAGRGAEAGGRREICAPIPGRIVSIAVAPGDRVERGQPLLVLEAMKMENQLAADGDGVVEEVLVDAGVTVEGGQALVVLA